MRIYWQHCEDGIMKAYGYLRVSGKAQVEGDGFVRQEQAIRQYATAHGYTIESVFREEGVSGTKDMESRPALLELLETVKETGGTVIIEKLDRLARDLMVSESILADFQRKGVTVVSVAEPDLCSSEPTRILMRQMMSAFAQYEKSMIVAKLRGARQRTKAKTGRCEGVKPYGALADEQAVLGRICALRAQGRTLVAISEALNAEGILPRRGAKWYPSSVRNVILREGAAA
jgi:DNA invertase Pin-like site-specific DNA recombinase